MEWRTTEQPAGQSTPCRKDRCQYLSDPPGTSRGRRWWSRVRSEPPVALRDRLSSRARRVDPYHIMFLVRKVPCNSRHARPKVLMTEALRLLPCMQDIVQCAVELYRRGTRGKHVERTRPCTEMRRDTVKCYCIAQRCTTSVVVSPSEAECIAHERSTVRTIKLTEPADRTIKS